MILTSLHTLLVCVLSEDSVANPFPQMLQWNYEITKRLRLLTGGQQMKCMYVFMYESKELVLREYLRDDF